MVALATDNPKSFHPELGTPGAYSIDIGANSKIIELKACDAPTEIPALQYFDLFRILFSL